jgi:DNA-binding transcriptional ArsR family regulator
LGEDVGVTGSVLTHHVKHLVSAGLVEQRRDGRRILCSVVITEVEALSSFLIAECCADLGAVPTKGTRPMADLTQNPRPIITVWAASTRWR